MSTGPAAKGTVYLVGAGPGDPELLTLRAARLLREADIVLYDDLVPDAVLALCGERTLRTSVGKRCGRARVTQAAIHTLMIDSARRGRAVVRLKSGDPLVFGRAAEELHALRAAGIPVEVVPGVSAVFAAGAAMQVPLTDRRSASKLILIAGQHASDKSAPQPLWTGTLPLDATLAIYMPGRDAAAIAQELRAAGLLADLPCVAVSHAATPQQHVAAAPLSHFADVKMGAAPVLVLAGYAMAALLRDDAIGQELEQTIGAVLATISS